MNGNYYLAIGYLRAFITLLVLAHHAVLAYHPFSPVRSTTLTAQPRWWEAFPVVDPHKWMGWSFFTGFNDVFFMSLMFFLSGLFVSGSIRHKGVGRFLRDRQLRLVGCRGDMRRAVDEAPRGMRPEQVGGRKGACASGLVSAAMITLGGVLAPPRKG